MMNRISRINLVCLVILSSLLLAPVVIAQDTKPAPAPANWRPLLGEYVLDAETIIILEKDGKLSALYTRTDLAPLHQVGRDLFEFDAGTTRAGGRIRFLRDSRRKITSFRIGAMIFKRRPLGPEEGASQLKVTPLRPVPILLKEAKQASPPTETGDFITSDLVELRKTRSNDQARRPLRDNQQSFRNGLLFAAARFPATRTGRSPRSHQSPIKGIRLRPVGP